MKIIIRLYVCAEVQSDALDADCWQNTDAYQAFVVSLDGKSADEAVLQVQKAAAKAGLGPSEVAELGATIRTILASMQKG